MMDLKVFKMKCVKRRVGKVVYWFMIYNVKFYNIIVIEIIFFNGYLMRIMVVIGCVISWVRYKIDFSYDNCLLMRFVFFVSLKIDVYIRVDLLSCWKRYVSKRKGRMCILIFCVICFLFLVVKVMVMLLLVFWFGGLLLLLLFWCCIEW